MTTTTLPAGFQFARQHGGYDIYLPDDAGDLSLVIGHQDGYTEVDTSAIAWDDLDDLCGAAIEAMHAADEAVQESAISREHARHILADADQEEEWDRLSDYWIVTTANGDEELWIHGCDEPEVVNRTTTSWLGSPPSHWTAERFAVEMRT